MICSDFVSDFDLMLERKKEEMRKRRRKRKDVDIINDNDDLIDDMIRRMKVAAEVSCLVSFHFGFHKIVPIITLMKIY